MLKLKADEVVAIHRPEYFGLDLLEDASTSSRNVIELHFLKSRTKQNGSVIRGYSNIYQEMQHKPVSKQ